MENPPVSPPCLTDSVQVIPHSLPHEIPDPCSSFELPALISKAEDPPSSPSPRPGLRFSTRQAISIEEIK